MPSQQSTGCHDGGNFGQYSPSQQLGPYREATPLVVIEAQSPCTELCVQNPILLAQIIDDLLLLVIHPAGDGEQQQPKWI